MKKEIILLSLGVLLLSISACKRGCTDPLANNYDNEITKDDGSCVYIDAIEINEDITTATKFEGSNYLICSDIKVKSELTIAPGTRITMCEGSSITIDTSGFLNATGTLEQPIIISGKEALKGFWVGIAFKSNNPNNKLIHTLVGDAGSYSGWKNANVYVSENAQVAISNSLLVNSEKYGLYVEDGAVLPQFADNTFENNITGLCLSANQVAKLDSNSNYNSENVNDYIEVRAGTISNNQQWQATGTPLLLSDLTIEADLEILPNSILMMDANQKIDVKITGLINCVGTVTKPIIIRGKNNSAGYWAGINIESGSPNNKMIYTTIADGGQSADYEYSNIYVDGRLFMQNSIIKNANSYGVYVNLGRTLFADGSTISNSVSIVEENNTFIDNGAGADANCINECTVFFEW